MLEEGRIVQPAYLRLLSLDKPKGADTTPGLLKGASQAASDRGKLKSFFEFLVSKYSDPLHDTRKLESILDELELLESLQDYEEEGYIFKPTPSAYARTKGYILEAYRVLLADFPRPKIEPDGEGGIVLDWRNNGKIIRLSCRAKKTQTDYIYTSEKHGAKSASDTYLLQCLNWLAE